MTAKSSAHGAGPTGSSRVDGEVKAALTGNFFLRVGNAATGIMLTLFLAYINKTEFPVSPMIVGLFSTAFYATELVLAPFCGAQSDRRGRRWFLFFGPLLGFVAVLLTALAPVLARTPLQALFAGLATVMPAVLWILLSTRLIEGLSSAASIPTILSFLSARTEHDRALRGWVMGLFESSTAMAIVGGSVIGSLLWERLYAWAFAFLGIPYLISMVLFLKVREGKHEVAPERDLHESAMALLRQPAIWRFLPAWLAVNAVVGLWNTHATYQLKATARVAGPIPPGGDPLATQYLIGRFAEDPNGLAITLLVYALLFAGGSLLWARAFRRFTEAMIMRFALGGLFIGCLAAIVVNHSGDNAALRVGALFVLCVGILIQSGFLPAAVGYLARLSGLIAIDRGLLMGLYSVVLGGGSLIGGALGAPFVGGQIPLIPGGVDGVIALTTLLGIVSLFVVLALGDGEPDIAGGEDSDSIPDTPRAA